MEERAKKLRLEFFRRLKIAPCGERLEALLRFRLSPVLSGLKSAEVLSFNNGESGFLADWRIEGRGLSRKLDLETFTLREGEGSACVLFYNRERLTLKLQRARQRGLLSSFGYPDHLELSGFLEILRSRSLASCPDELGIVLGYPLGDVEGYLRHRGECYLCLGYWKVYERPERSQALFRRFDRLKQEAIERYLSGTAS